MVYVEFKGGLPIAVVDTKLDVTGGPGRVIQTSWDWKSLDQVEMLALRLTSMMRASYLGVDRGPSTYPRFDIVKAPAVGDLVSKSFNGDSYPCGRITRITKNFRCSTDTDHVFRRQGKTGSWLLTGGTWGMIPGHHNDRNPSF